MNVAFEDINLPLLHTNLSKPLCKGVWYEKRHLKSVLMDQNDGPKLACTSS